MTQHLADADSAAATGTQPGWWRDAVIYQVYPRSFADSNGDGMGDLQGVRSRLPYLRDLGVDAVWLSPFYASPQADAGYDVADYRAVDPMFGTLHDADALIRDAHELGLRIIVDLVPNHSSDQHEWFKQALRGGPGLAAARRATTSARAQGENGELPPNDWESIFGGPAWTRVAGRRVVPAPLRPRAARLQLGPPGGPRRVPLHPALLARPRRRRLPHRRRPRPGQGATACPTSGAHDQLKLLGNDVMPFFDQDGVHEIYRAWRRVLDEYAGDRIVVAEAWTPTRRAHRANYVRPDELHQAFNFQYLSTDWDAAALRRRHRRSLDAMRPVGAPATWVLSNHDVTRHATRFANPPGLGTQIRTPGDRELGLRRARAATLLMLALPGSAYVYQGEELGLPDVIDLPGRGPPGPVVLPRRPARTASATAAGCRSRGPRDGLVVRLRRPAAAGCRSRPSGAS